MAVFDLQPDDSGPDDGGRVNGRTEATLPDAETDDQSIGPSSRWCVAAESGLKAWR